MTACPPREDSVGFWDRVRSVFGATPSVSVTDRVTAAVRAKVAAQEPYYAAGLAEELGIDGSDGLRQVITAVQALWPEVEAQSWHVTDFVRARAVRVYHPALVDAGAWLQQQGVELDPVP